jgi:hypothetical protein
LGMWSSTSSLEVLKCGYATHYGVASRSFTSCKRRSRLLVLLASAHFNSLGTSFEEKTGQYYIALNCSQLRRLSQSTTGRISSLSLACLPLCKHPSGHLELLATMPFKPIDDRSHFIVASRSFTSCKRRSRPLVLLASAHFNSLGANFEKKTGQYYIALNCSQLRISVGLGK